MLSSYSGVAVIFTGAREEWFAAMCVPGLVTFSNGRHILWEESVGSIMVMNKRTVWRCRGGRVDEGAF